MSAESAEIGVLKSEIGFSLFDNTGLNLKGSVKFTKGLLSEKYAALTGSEALFAIDSSLTDSKELRINNAFIETEKAGLKFNGSIDLKKMSLKIRFNTGSMDLTPFEQISGKKISGTMAISGEFSGPVFSPAVNLDLKVSNLETDGLHSDDINGRLQIKRNHSNQSSSPVFLIKGKGEINKYPQP